MRAYLPSLAHPTIPIRQSMEIPSPLVERLFRLSCAEQWNVPREQFAEVLRSSAARQFSKRTPGSREVERYLTGLHLEDLALACGCACGNDAAWERFVTGYRPSLYRAADALDPSGGARELADSLYGELFGLEDRDGNRRSLFRYFHGRSSLATWLRAVLAQRHIDRLRLQQRFEELPDDDSPRAMSVAESETGGERARYSALIEHALGLALGALDARDRLRLGCYYVQELTLAQTGKLLREHEATVSRQLDRTRRALRSTIERYLRVDAQLSPDEITRCFQSVADDAESIDLADLLRARKESVPDRSN